jgi:hypothetical protein
MRAENRPSVWWQGVRERTLPTRVRTLDSAGAHEFSSINIPTGASAWVGRTNTYELCTYDFNFEKLAANYCEHVTLGRAD